MAVFSVHLPPAGAGAAADAAFVRQGFCGAAFVFGLLWLLARRFFLPAALWLVVLLAVVALAGASAISPGGAFALVLLMHAWLGVSASRLIEARLARRGYDLAFIVAAPTLEEAEMEFFRAVGTTPRQASPPPPASRPSGVIGSMPAPQARGAL